MSVEKCLFCGADIPEGRQVCPHCEKPVLISRVTIAEAACTPIKAILNEFSKTESELDTALREITGKSFAELQKEGKSTAEIVSILLDNATVEYRP